MNLVIAYSWACVEQSILVLVLLVQLLASVFEAELPLAGAQSLRVLHRELGCSLVSLAHMICARSGGIGRVKRLA